MTQRKKILHLIDDTTAGGVTRVVDFICNSKALRQADDHIVHKVQRGRFGKLPSSVDMIVSHTTISWRALPALIALRAARHATQIIHVEHSYTSAFVSLNVPRKTRFKSLLKVAFSLFDRVVAVSHAQADWLISGNMIEAQKLTTIQSCVDLTPFQSLPRPLGPIKTIGAIGRLDSQKGFDLLIGAFKSLQDPSLRLKVIGTGPQEDTLRTLAGADTRIEFVGFCANPAQMFDAVDAVIMPSRWEAFGLVAIEALAAGRPLLCARVDGLLDHQAHGAKYFGSYTQATLANEIEDFIQAPQAVDVPYLASTAMAAFESDWIRLIATQQDAQSVKRTGVPSPTA